MQQLLDLMKTLRRECPWDRAQTPRSLTRYAIEEAYEVEAAVQAGNVDDIKKELGDLLLQVVFQAEMYAEQGAFDFQDVVNALCEKLIRRHPHVFEGKPTQPTDAQLQQQWQTIKALEKQQAGELQGLLSHIKPGPALNQAQAIQKQAAQVGFDFADVAAAQAKVSEEILELEEAIAQQNVANIQAEMGDCLFAMVNVARKLNINSEAALLDTIHKFRSRFAYIEQQATQHQKTLQDFTLEQMDALWEQAKQLQQQAHNTSNVHAKPDKMDHQSE